MITVDRLDELISSTYTSHELSLIGWTDVTEDDKRALINKADKEIDKGMYIGDCLEDDQAHVFPRIYDGEVYGIDCVEDAIVNYIYNHLYIEKDERMQAIKVGISSIKVAEASESYTSNSNNSNLIHNLEVEYKGYLSDYIYRGVY